MGDTSEGLAPGSTSGRAAPAVIVHGLAHARAAVALADPARGLVLCSAPGAGVFAGAGWFAALAAQAAAARPELTLRAVLDCADSAGAVLAAFRAGIACAVFTGGAAPAAALAGIAQQGGFQLLRAAPRGLDLRAFRAGEPGWAARLHLHLTSAAG